MTHHKYQCSGCAKKLTKEQWSDGHLCNDCKLKNVIVEEFECIECGKKHLRDWRLDDWYKRRCRKCFEEYYFNQERLFYKDERKRIHK